MKLDPKIVEECAKATRRHCGIWWPWEDAEPLDRSDWRRQVRTVLRTYLRLTAKGKKKGKR